MLVLVKTAQQTFATMRGEAQVESRYLCKTVLSKKAALQFWFVGDFKCGVPLFIVICDVSEGVFFLSFSHDMSWM